MWMYIHACIICLIIIFFCIFYSSFTIKMTRTEALNVWLKDVIESQNVFDKQ